MDGNLQQIKTKDNCLSASNCFSKCYISMPINCAYCFSLCVCGNSLSTVIIDFLSTVKAAPHECVIRTGLPYT